MTDSTQDSQDYGRTHDVFLSYAREDAAAAESLRRHLVEAGLNVFLDTRSLVPGGAWEHELDVAISGAAVFVLVLTRDWLDSPTCAAEQAIAIAQGKTILAFTPIPPDGPPVEGVAATTTPDLDVVLRSVRDALPVGRQQARLELAAVYAESSTDFQGRRGWIDLRQLRDVLASHGIRPSARAEEYTEQVRHRRRLVLLRATAVGALVVALATGGVLFDQAAGGAHARADREARYAEAIVLARQSMSEDGVDAVVTALRAVDRAALPEAIDAARTALSGVAPVEGIRHFSAPGSVRTLGITSDLPAAIDASGRVTTPDGAWQLADVVEVRAATIGTGTDQALVLDASGRLGEWDLGTRTRLADRATSVTALADTADSSILAWANGTRITVAGSWEASVEAPAPVTSLAVWPEPRALAAADSAGQVWVCLEACTTWQTLPPLKHGVAARMKLTPALFADDRADFTLATSWGLDGESFTNDRGNWTRSGRPTDDVLPGGIRASLWSDVSFSFPDQRGFTFPSRGIGLGAPAPVNAAAVQEGGRATMAVLRTDGVVLWHRGELPETPGSAVHQRAPGTIVNVAGSYDGGVLVTATSDDDKSTLGSFLWADGDLRPAPVLALDPGEVVTSYLHARDGATSAGILSEERTVVWHEGTRLGTIDVGVPAVHPAGDRIAGLADGTVRVWQVAATGLTERSFPAPNAAAGLGTRLAWAGDVLVLAARTGHVAVVDASSGEVQVARDLPLLVEGVGATDRADIVVLTTPDGVIVLDSALREVSRRRINQAGTPRLAADGRWVVLGPANDDLSFTLPELKPLLQRPIKYSSSAWLPEPRRGHVVLQSDGALSPVCAVCGWGTDAEVVAALRDAAVVLGITGSLEPTRFDPTPPTPTFTPPAGPPPGLADVRAAMAAFYAAAERHDDLTLRALASDSAVQTYRNLLDQPGMVISADPMGDNCQWVDGIGTCGLYSYDPDARECAGAMYTATMVLAPPARLYITGIRNDGNAC